MMDYQIKHCPNCDGELHVPAELESCICMYCGEKLNFQMNKPVDDIPESARQNLESNYRKALERLSLLADDYELLLEQFTGRSYVDGFQKYVLTGTTVLHPAERYASLSEDDFSLVIEELSESLLGIIANRINNIKGNILSTSKAKTIDQYRFFLAVYSVPMILHLKFGISEPLADRIIEKWGHRYPKYTFVKGNYEALRDGFKKKGPFGFRL